MGICVGSLNPMPVLFNVTDVSKCANQEKSLDKNVIYCVPSQRWMSKRSKAILESTKCKICHNKNSLEGVINISHWWHCIVSIFSFLVQIFCKSNVCIYLSIVLSSWRQNSQQFRDSECVRNNRRARGMCRVAAVTLEREGWVYVRPISSHSYWLECWQCRQECGDRSTLSHTQPVTHTRTERREALTAKQTQFPD